VHSKKMGKIGLSLARRSKLERMLCGDHSYYYCNAMNHSIVPSTASRGVDIDILWSGVQQHFEMKKQPHAAIEVPPALQRAKEFVLTLGFQSMSTPSGV